MKIKHLLNKVDNFSKRHAARITGILGLSGDIFSSLSGSDFGNLGRRLSGLVGTCGNLPIILFSGREKKPDEIDPQDLPFRQKIKHIWKFWKYPFEFASLAALTQSFAWATFSGPDTASALGEAINVNALASNDQVRFAETTVGVAGLFAASVGFISEAERAPEPPKQKGILRSLKNDFNGVAGFVNNRARDLTSERLLVHRGLSTAFTNGCIEISFAGPNRVAAKTWNTVLYPWAAESLYYQDWNNLKAFAFYRACNWFFERSSKRTVAAAPVPV